MVLMFHSVTDLMVKLHNKEYLAADNAFLSEITFCGFVLRGGLLSLANYAV